MAQKSGPPIGGGLETGRLGGSVRAGTPAFYRKVTTQSARADMDAIVAKYRQIVNHLKGVTPEIVMQVMMPVFEKSQEYVPVDTGLLKSSGKIEYATIKGRRGVVITYGGPARYAALVHERMTVRHKPPTRAKYLSSAFEEEYAGFLAHLAILYATELKRA